MRVTRSRRGVLLSLLALCGCTTAPLGERETVTTSADRAAPSTTADTTMTDETTATDPTRTDGGRSTDEATSSLDLREANVIEVSVAHNGGTEYRFDVTLYHDDDGEGGYADWWQVETRDGEQLGRRDLLHAHSTAPFTRSTTVSIPDGVECVVVRGHDQTHGYGGQVMLVTLATGTTRAVEQGVEPRSMADEPCP